MKKLNKVLALALAASMVVSLAACGKDKDNAASNKSATPTPVVSGNQTTAKATSTPTPTPTLAPLKITVSLPSNDEHLEENVYYDQVVKTINEYTNMDVTWEWNDDSTYYDDEHLGLKISTGDVADVLVVGTNAAFYAAANEGLFWDLTPYIDDYDNLAQIPEAFRAYVSSNGKMFGIPRSRTLARNGLGYRLDWLNNLGLAEPTTWEDYYKMLYAFTYNDPDGNGVDDTVGLGLDNWDGVWNIMMLWFGVPNDWGLDKNGDLIFKFQTEEYKTALKAFRQLYSEGLINNGANGIPDFRDINPGKARDTLQRQSLAGSGVQVLDDQRKVQTYFQDNGITTEDEIIYTLQGYVDTGLGAFCMPQLGGNNMVAISTVNIKTEAQLRQVLQFLNDVNDGDMLNLIDYGIEGVTWHLNDEGYIEMYTGDEATEKLNGASGTYRNGFNQILAYFTADENARKVTLAPETAPIRVLENELYAEDVQYLVTNYGLSYQSSTPTFINSELKSQLDTIMADAQKAYIVGEIDDTGLEAAINQWVKAGGAQYTKEINELYHAAGH
ncbi:MAG: extracellular solute-binding protein [Lachnospiraceae bacterium]|nr:extracellular solute-binding protein [Lachnospiraceae bacterium]